MRQLKTPDEINLEVDRNRNPALDYDHQCILVAQRDALECIEYCIPEIKWPMNGYAPGSYYNKCGACENTFLGDKLAVRCEACALALYMQAIKENIGNLLPKEL